MEVGMDNGKIFKVAPSGVDYALKCKRCLCDEAATRL